MLDTKLFTAFIVFVLVLTLVAENEVDAAPKPCFLLDMLAKPEKLKKPKEEKKDVPDDAEKSKKAMKKPLQKLEKMFEALIEMK